MKTILIIEDDRTIRTKIVKVLEHRGFEVFDVGDGLAGVELAKEHLPDLILCDIMMPVQDGYGVLRALRQEPETCAIPFIFLTGKTELTDLRRGMNLGADDYITKPFTGKDLIEAINTRLKKQSDRAQPYISQLKATAETLGRAAYIDLLTNLPNRIGLHQHLQSLIAETSGEKGFIAVLCLNLNRFREVNETYGYATGDLLLQEIAARLRSFTGSNSLAARLSADQFVIALPPLANSELLDDRIQRLEAVLREPYLPNGQEIHVLMGLGVALYPHHGSRAEQLVAYAETAMRWGRENGVEGYQVYTSAIDAESREGKQLTQELMQAVQRDEFYLLYQPQVNLITNRVIGLESFLRWKHPKRGILLPPKFLLLAKEQVLVEAISEWTLRASCLQGVRCQEMSLVPISVSVNMSTLQFHRPNLLQMVSRVLAETGLEPHLLTLELTESSLVGETDSVCRTLTGLKDIGVKVAVDDFGMGYSSLKDLGKFPLDALKIDSFFVQHVEDEHYAAVVSSIIAIAQTLKLKVIAEGVETEQQLGILRKYGCHAMQGHLHSLPMPADEIYALLKEGGRPTAARPYQKQF